MLGDTYPLPQSHAPTTTAVVSDGLRSTEGCTDSREKTTEQQRTFLQVQKSRPKLLKRLSAQSILTRQKQRSHSNEDYASQAETDSEGRSPNNVSAKNVLIESFQGPVFAISTPSIIIATCQKEVMTTTTFPAPDRNKVGRSGDKQHSSEEDETRHLQPKLTTNNDEQQETSQNIQTMGRPRRSSTGSVYSISSSRRSSKSSSSVLLTPSGDLSRIDARHKSMPTISSVETLEKSHVNEANLFGVPGTVAAVCGYTLASDKRNHDFHALFRSVPELDCLIDDYVCALHKEILLQGHMYVSEHHVCFKSNIFGFVTNLVISFNDIISIEKRMTAKFIPNGIQISTLHTKHCFASLLSRDHTYDQLHKLWKMHHKHDENTRTLQPHSRSDFALEDDEEQDPSGIHDGFLTDVSASSTSQSDHPKSPSTDDKDNPETNDGPDQQQRAVIALDATYPGDVEEMYRLLFKSKLMHRFLSKYEGCRDIQFGEWKGGLRKSSYEHKFGRFRDLYIKCDQEDRIVEMDTPHTAIIESSICLPETPFGCAVDCRSRTCISRVDGSQVKVVVTFDLAGLSEVSHDGLFEREMVLRQRALYNRLHKVLQRKMAKKQSKKQEVESRQVNDTAGTTPPNIMIQTVSQILSIPPVILVAVAKLLQSAIRMRASGVIALCITASVIINVIISLQMLGICTHLDQAKSLYQSSRIQAAAPDDNISLFAGQFLGDISYIENLQTVEEKIRVLLNSLTDIQNDVQTQAQQLQLFNTIEDVGAENK